MLHDHHLHISLVQDFAGLSGPWWDQPTTPPDLEEDDMPLTDSDIKKIVSAVWGAEIGTGDERVTLAQAIGKLLKDAK